MEQNQVQNTNDTDFFGDIEFDNEGNITSIPTDDEPKVEEPKESVEEDTTKEPVEEEATELPFLQIKYNKENYDLTKDEAIELAQKGKNYDHLHEKYESLNERIDKLARLNGMTVDDYIGKLNDTQIAYQTSVELDKLKEKYPDSNEELLKDLAEKNAREILSNQLKQEADVRANEMNASQAEAKRQLDMFMAEYPNVDIRTLPKRVEELVNDGYSLLEAYEKTMREENAKAKPVEEAKAKASQLNEENKNKSLGSTTNASSVEGENDFFVGLNSI